MRNIHKILFLGAAISCLALLPGKESSAKDTVSLPQELASEVEEENSLELYNDDSVFILKPAPLSSLKGDGFNENVSFAKYEKNILQEDTHTLEILDLDEGCDVSFKSSDTSVLTVEQLSNTSCSYTGVSYGTAKITVTITKTTAFFFKEKKTIHAKVNVTPKAVSVMFRQNVRKIALGTKNKKLPLIIRPSISKEVPVFKSLNKKIVTINKKGKITARKLGTTHITATLLNGKIAKCKIIVLEEVTDIYEDDLEEEKDKDKDKTEEDEE